MVQSFFAAEAICNTPRRRKIFERQVRLPAELGDILAMLRKEPKAQIFLNRVSKREAPDYYDVIKKPMDLGTVGRKLHLYRNVSDFKADLDLIWSNCLTYNTLEYFINCATEMKEIADTLLRGRNCVGFELPETVRYEGIPVHNGREELVCWVASSLRVIGFTSVQKTALTILVDVIEHRMCKKLIKWKEDGEDSKKITVTEQK